MNVNSGIIFYNRLTNLASTTSDLQQSTSATVDTVATSARFIVNSRQESVDGAMQKCGLCSLLGRYLRRAMCVGSRRGSDESYYQELAETAASPPSPKSSSLKHSPYQDLTPTIKTTDGAIYVCLISSSYHHGQRTASRCSDTINNGYQTFSIENDLSLLEGLLDEDNYYKAKKRQLSNGRFLTMHKRRRKKLTTRSLNQDSAILDDIFHGQVQCILTQIGNWRFNAFTLEAVTGGRSLPVICVHLFHWYGLLDHFNLDVVRLWKLFTLIEEGYHSTNPYHNSIHATDVTQAMHCFLQEYKIFEYMEPIEIMSSLLGAVTHDLDHPGVNQPFLIATSNHLAALYENTSVLENHHWRSAVGCLLESGVAEQIHNIRPTVEKQIASLILATDITRQTEFLSKFRNFLDTNTLDMKISENRHFILQISLKCADISNPCRPWDISKKWSQKVCEEFFRQGDFERQLNLPVTSLCDRYTTSVPKIQVGFFKYVVTPLFDEWHRFLKTELSTKMMKYLKENEIQWENRVATENAEETKTEMSDAEIIDEDFVDDEEADICIELSDSSEVLLPEINQLRRSSLQVPKFGRTRFDRRHSVPANPPKIILPRNENRSGFRDIIDSKLEDSLSLLSSNSDSDLKKSSAASVHGYERPLSSETLIPELNIATMSKSLCADQLHIIMHGGMNTFNTAALSVSSVSRQLIRQQTFPPLQPFIRTRYMSTTAEMSGCTQSSEKSPNQHKINEKNSCKDINTKPSQSFYRNELGYKTPKLSIPEQKENMDPSKSKNFFNKRRGSAPMEMLFSSKLSTEEQSFCNRYIDIPAILFGEGKSSCHINTCDTFIRRSSVPVDMITSRDKLIDTGVVNPSNVTIFQRRGSVPFDNISRVHCNGKTRHRKKLRRRSSSGIEILSPIAAQPEDDRVSRNWNRFKHCERQKCEVETLLLHRRGSLPVEVLAACNTGTLLH